MNPPPPAAFPRKVVFLTFHNWTTLRQGGFHKFAEATADADIDTVFFSLAWSSTLAPSAPVVRWCARLTEPRLQTAISWALVFSVISVQRLLECTTPTCCCGERRLQASLNVIHGWPVSNSIVSILRHRSTARTRLKSLISPERVFSS